MCVMCVVLCEGVSTCHGFSEILQTHARVSRCDLVVWWWVQNEVNVRPLTFHNDVHRGVKWPQISRDYSPQSRDDVTDR